MFENDLDRIERELSVDPRRGHVPILQKDQTYYPQIDRAIRLEASEMSEHYEVFYLLEKSIRSLVRDTVLTAEGENWWQTLRVPPKIKQDAETRLQREVDSGMTLRSSDPLDFTTFGELGEMIKTNWDLFGSIFTSPKAVEKVMASLNSLRGPIAHCTRPAEDEVVRLRLSVRDWFRLME